MSLSAAADTPPAPAPGAAGVVDRFDAAVARGFPARVEVSAQSGQGRSRRVAGEAIVVESRLKVSVTSPDGAVGEMFQGRFDGSDAAFTRVGDDLGVSLPGDDAVRVIAFHKGEEDVVRRTFPARQGDDGEALSGVETIGAGHVEDPLAYQPTFHVFLHDDLRTESYVVLHGRFVAWWLRDMAYVLPVTWLNVIYRTRVPWVTDMDYEQPDVLIRFHRALSALADADKLPAYGRSYKHKFLLLTARPAIPGTTGLAVEGQSEATASVTGYTTIVAHEFGHTLGATHEKAEVRQAPSLPFSLLPWHVCDTNMHPTATAPYSCHHYSASNEQAIRSYMRHGPVAENSGIWLDR